MHASNWAPPKQASSYLARVERGKEEAFSDEKLVHLQASGQVVGPGSNQPTFTVFFARMMRWEIAKQMKEPGFPEWIRHPVGPCFQACV